jgi:uncharacterized protein YkwD
MPRTAFRTSRRLRLLVEQLEPRHLPSGYQPTAAAQLFLEELNDARANPTAYGLSIGVDLSGVAPAAPLAFNTHLIQAAQQHSQDMNARAYFGHITPSGADPGNRIRNAGFVWTAWQESIAAGSYYPGPTDALRALITDAGVGDLSHRRQLLAIDALFKYQTQVGVGIVLDGAGPLENYYTIDTAAAADSRPFLTGVVYDDRNATDHYYIGEGLRGVRISVSGVGSTTTFASGGYSIQLGPGTYTVTASGGGLSKPLTRRVTIGSTNVRLNFSPRDDAFVRALYRTELGRAPGAWEVGSWVSTLHNIGHAAVAAAIADSPEAQFRRVKQWYRTYLGRTASDAEASGWVNDLAGGATEEQMLIGLLGSNEFYQRAQRLVAWGSSDQRYIEAIYKLLLHRWASAEETAGWVRALSALGRGGVLRGFLYSTEYRSDLVAGFYSSLLRRRSAPSAAEVISWVNSGLDEAAIRIAFLSSAEFWLKA